MHVKQLSFISSAMNYCVVSTTFRKLVFSNDFFTDTKVATYKINFARDFPRCHD